jgi:hypothetical protein
MNVAAFKIKPIFSHSLNIPGFPGFTILTRMTTNISTVPGLNLIVVNKLHKSVLT